MLWTKWPYWLRGGVIAAGLTIVSGLVIFSCGQIAPHFMEADISGESAGFACLPFAIISPLLPFEILTDTNPFFHSLFFESKWLFVLFSAAVWFIVGATIGALVKFYQSL
jgi:hypothetical protein